MVGKRAKFLEYNNFNIYLSKNNSLNIKKNNLSILVLMIWSTFLFAQTPFVGEIRMVAGNFAPAGSTIYERQLLPTSESLSLFIK